MKKDKSSFDKPTNTEAMDLRRFRTIIIAIILSGFTSSCVEDQDLIVYEEKTNVETDGITMATPDGGEFKPAEEGPVRSALGEPTINLDTFQLTITGLVDSSYTLSWEEIKELPAAYSGIIIMYCIEGWEVWGNWKGVSINDLLYLANVHTDEEFILFECLDGYKTALPISYLVKYNAMLAYEVNDAPLQEHDGFPLRLIAFGKYGYKWAKWVTRLRVMNESQIGYWEKRGLSDQADVSIDRRKYYEGENVKPLEY